MAPPKKKNKPVRFQLLFSEPMLDWLKKKASRRDESVATVIRSAVFDLMNREAVSKKDEKSARKKKRDRYLETCNTLTSPCINCPVRESDTCEGCIQVIEAKLKMR